MQAFSKEVRYTSHTSWGRDWLLAHNGAAGGSSLRLVVFDVFTEADVDAYSAAIASAFPTYEAVGR